ncbi:MAG: hypothetical protein ACYS0I_10915 [Planctomycetota bacterium]
MPIKICSYRAVNYTLLKAIQKITGDEIMDALETIYNDTEGPVHDILWDLGEAYMIDMTDTEYAQIKTFLKTHVKKQMGGKTAIYIPGNIGYSIAKHQIKLAKNLSVKIKAFRYYHEAAVWLTKPNKLIVISSTN